MDTQDVNHPHSENCAHGQVPDSFLDDIAAAEQGDADACFRLGSRYYWGNGVERDPAQAVHWYRKAAVLGHAEAQYQLGVYWHAKEDKVQAVYLYRQAAEQGHAYAQYWMGFFCLRGIGTTRDPSQGIRWYHKAADQGSRVAQIALATCYANGLGVPRDPDRSAYWRKKAKINT